MTQENDTLTRPDSDPALRIKQFLKACEVDLEVKRARVRLARAEARAKEHAQNIDAEAFALYEALRDLLQWQGQLWDDGNPDIGGREARQNGISAVNRYRAFTGLDRESDDGNR